MPAFLRDAFQNIRNFFANLGWINLAGYTLIALSTYFFGPIMGVVSAALFGGYKWMTQQPYSSPATAPAPPVQTVQIEQLPPGTVRSRYHQGNIALSDPSLPRNTQTCGAITASLANYFYEHAGFAGLTPEVLDGLLAQGTRLDAVARQRGGVPLQEGIDINDFFRGLPPGALPYAQLPQRTIPFHHANFQALLYECIAFCADGPIAAILWSRGHFTGLYIARRANREIEQIYVSESASHFPNGFPHVSGGATVIPLGNTIEEAAERLSHYYNNDPGVHLYPITRSPAGP
ncbi:MAG: hypothetical protein KGI83_06105 [Verrucomicrobiota bacterium]|nr:hypothetical protein [Verrucomicrobiota bacterium]